MKPSEPRDNHQAASLMASRQIQPPAGETLMNGALPGESTPGQSPDERPCGSPRLITAGCSQYLTVQLDRFQDYRAQSTCPQTLKRSWKFPFNSSCLSPQPCIRGGPVSQEQVFSTRSNFAPREQLAMSGDNFAHHSWGGVLLPSSR